VRKSNYKQFGIPNLFVVGGGFAILILVTFFGLDHQKSSQYSFEDLKNKHVTLDDDEAYTLMNQAIFDRDSILTDSLLFIKLNVFTLKHSSDLKSFINEASDSLINPTDKRYMIKQLSDMVSLWDNQKLTNVWCLTPKDFAKIERSDSTDYWEEFQANFGSYGRHNYSRPVFNQDKTLCVIEHSGQGNWLAGSGSVLLFKKLNGNWIKVKEELLWIS
jgi:hypothetical protein